MLGRVEPEKVLKPQASLKMLSAANLRWQINPFVPNVFSHPYQFDESISNSKVVGKHFSFLFKF